MATAKILVIDDEPKFLGFVTEVLIGAGYEVRGSENPLAAVTLAEEFQPALIVLDLLMPGKDGFEVAKDLRASAKISGTPILFLSARKAEEGLETSKDSGAAAYLEKPVPSSKLLWMIRTLLGENPKAT